MNQINAIDSIQQVPKVQKTKTIDSELENKKRDNGKAFRTAENELNENFTFLTNFEIF